MLRVITDNLTCYIAITQMQDNTFKNYISLDVFYFCYITITNHVSRPHKPILFNRHSFVAERFVFIRENPSRAFIHAVLTCGVDDLRRSIPSAVRGIVELRNFEGKTGQLRQCQQRTALNSAEQHECVAGNSAARIQADSKSRLFSEGGKSLPLFILPHSLSPSLCLCLSFFAFSLTTRIRRVLETLQRLAQKGIVPKGIRDIP